MGTDEREGGNLLVDFALNEIQGSLRELGLQVPN